MTTCLFLLALVGLLPLSVTSAGATTTVSDTVIVLDSAAAAQAVSCRLEIESVLIENGRVEDTLDVLLSALGIAPAGCMLKIGVDGSQLGILKILPGEIVDSCRWEMFSAMPIPPLDADIGPRELWQVTALAQTLSDSASPPCYTFDRPASIARIVISSAHLGIVPDTTVEVFFYWEDCRDNALSDSDGRSILISGRVTDNLPETFLTPTDRFPTRHGAPKDCVSPRAYIKPRRVVDFVSGGVEFRLNLAPGPDSVSN